VVGPLAAATLVLVVICAAAASAAPGQDNPSTPSTPGVATASPPDGPVSASVTERALRSVGKVTSSGFGSGWIAAPGTVITNFHVARTTEIYFTPPGGSPLRCYRAAANREGDVAALKCPTGSRPHLPLRQAQPTMGETVVMIGYPGGVGPTVTSGVVVDTNREINGIATIGVTAAGEPGSSGSPIMDARGRVIAVGTFAGMDGAAINGFKAAEVRELLDEAGYLPATQSAAEWRLRIIRSLLLGVVAGLVGAYLQWRSGYAGIARRAARYVAVAVLFALATTQLQLWIDGPVHFL